jgi:catechol 2,3-dioxygenase-like lactoylglutathione lyase family enzyme
MDQRLSLVTLGVADLERSAAFYEKGLGWKRANKDAGVVFFQLPGMVLGLWSRAALAEEIGIADHGGFGGIALAYNARSREEVDRVLAEAGSAPGGTVIRGAGETFWGGYSGYFCDPDGHHWEVAHNPFWTIRPDGSLSISG